MHSVSASLCLLAAVLVAGCSSAAEEGGSLIVENPYEGALQSGPAPFELELVQTFGAEEEPVEAMLSTSYVTMATDADGNVYVMDRRQLLAFAPDGELLWTSGSEGEAPGEFKWPGTVVHDGRDRLYVSNQSRTRIDAFDLNGQYVRSIPVESLGEQRLNLVGFADDSTLVAAAPVFGRYAVDIFVIDTADDESWKVRRSFRIDQTGDTEVPQNVSTGPNITLIDGTLGLSNAIRYEFMRLDLTGDTLAVVRRDVADYTRSGVYEQGSSVSIRSFSSLEGPYGASEGRLIVHARWPTNVTDPDEFVRLLRNDAAPEIDWLETLDLYDADGKLLYSRSADDLGIGNPVYQDADGYIYTRSSAPYPRISKYRILETG